MDKLQIRFREPFLKDLIYKQDRLGVKVKESDLHLLHSESLTNRALPIYTDVFSAALKLGYKKCNLPIVKAILDQGIAPKYNAPWIIATDPISSHQKQYFINLHKKGSALDVYLNPIIKSNRGGVVTLSYWYGGNWWIFTK